MSVLIKNMEMPKGCIYANDNDQTEYCPLLNHDDVPFCRYIESEPEIAIGIDERPAYCPLSDVPDTNVGDTISRQAAIDALEKQLDYLQMLNNYENPTAESKWYGVNWARNTIADLPSAQPEIIRCKDCKHWRQQTNYQGAPLPFGFCESDDMWRSLYGETYEVSHIDTDDDFYCGHAERRADETD